MNTSLFVSYEDPTWASKQLFISNEPESKIIISDNNLQESKIVLYFKNKNQKKIKILSKIIMFYLSKKRTNNYLSSLEC